MSCRLLLLAAMRLATWPAAAAHQSGWHRHAVTVGLVMAPHRQSIAECDQASGICLLILSGSHSVSAGSKSHVCCASRGCGLKRPRSPAAVKREQAQQAECCRARQHNSIAATGQAHVAKTWHRAQSSWHFATARIYATTGHCAARAHAMAAAERHLVPTGARCSLLLPLHMAGQHGDHV